MYVSGIDGYNRRFYGHQHGSSRKNPLSGMEILRLWMLP